MAAAVRASNVWYGRSGLWGQGVWIHASQVQGPWTYTFRTQGLGHSQRHVPGAAPGLGRDLLPAASLPGPRGLPLVGLTLHRLLGEKHSMHKFVDKYYRQHDSLFKINFGVAVVICLRQPAHVETVWKHDGKHPKRLGYDSWKLYKEIRGVKPALIQSDGEEWQKNRSAVNVHMMRPHNVAMHTEDFSDIARDFVTYLGAEIEKTGDGRAKDLSHDLLTWSFESGCSLILEERLGTFGPRPSPDATRFVRAVDAVTKTMDHLTVPARLARRLGLRQLRLHFQALDDVFEYGRKVLTRKMSRVRAELSAGEARPGLVTSMLQTGTLSEEEVVSTAVDALMGAVDTTARSVFWSLYLMSKHPEVQEKLYAEVKGHCRADGSVGQEQLKEMPYLKAFYKEVLRLYPIAPFISRVSQEDMAIDGYHIPESSVFMVPLWSMGRDPQLYGDPEHFRPERWLSESAHLEQIDPYASLSFGFGPRACIGRRIAELQSYLVLCEIVRQFEVKDARPDVTLDTQHRVILAPTQRENFVFRKRED